MFPNAPGGKEHIGYIVDRTGFEEFKRWALKNVVLPEKAEVITTVYWKGIKYSIPTVIASQCAHWRGNLPDKGVILC